jgi:hypothetical protein
MNWERTHNRWAEYHAINRRIAGRNSLHVTRRNFALGYMRLKYGPGANPERAARFYVRYEWLIKPVLKQQG